MNSWRPMITRSTESMKGAAHCIAHCWYCSLLLLDNKKWKLCTVQHMTSPEEHYGALAQQAPSGSLSSIGDQRHRGREADDIVAENRLVRQPWAYLCFWSRSCCRGWSQKWRWWSRYLGRDQRMTPPESPRESVHNNTSQVGSIEFNLKDKALFACLTLTYWNLKYGRIAVKICNNFVSQGMDTTNSLDHLEGREQGSSSTKNIFGYSFRHF